MTTQTDDLEVIIIIIKIKHTCKYTKTTLKTKHYKTQQ